MYWQGIFLTRLTLNLVLFTVILGNNKTKSQIVEVSQLTSTAAATRINSNLIPGIYDYESSQNFENYLQELGVSYILRKLAKLASPTVTISTSCQTENLSNVSTYTFSTEYLFLSIHI